MIDYKDLTRVDFTNYWGNCFVFKYDSTTREVTPWGIVDQVYGADGTPSVTGPIETGRAKLINASIPNNLIPKDENRNSIVDGENVVLVPIEDLFNRPEYITHRFQVGYVRTPSDTLYQLSLEPMMRRMSKGTSFNNLQMHGIACNGTNDSDPLAPRVRDYLLGRLSHGYEKTDILRAISDVLQVGHTPCMRRNVDRARASATSHEEVLGMLRGDHDQRVVVPDFSTAIVGHRNITGRATVLQHGTFVGTLSLSKDREEVVLTASSTKYVDREARKLARVAVERQSNQLYANTVRWVA